MFYELNVNSLLSEAPRSGRLHSSKVLEPQSTIIVDAESTLSDISVLAVCGTFYHTCAIMITACSVVRVQS